MDETSDLQSLETHRFRVNEISSQRLKSFRDDVDLMKQGHSEIVGATVYGSSVVGMATENSDIDAYVFVDADIAGLDEDGNFGVRRQKGDKTLEQLEEMIQKPLRERVKENLNFSDDDVKDIRVMVLSKKRIDKELNELISYRKSLRDRKPGDPSPEYPYFGVSDIFHMQLGNGLDSYRAYIVDRLGAEGEIGNQVIADMHASVSTTEGRTPKDIRRERDQWPQTVEEARKAYNLNFVVPRYPIENLSQPQQ